jgi:hypothetical protein
MYWQTKVFTWLASMIEAFLTALTARPAAALLTTPTVVLFTAGPAPGESSDIADYTLGGSSGYEAVTPVFSPVLNFPTGAKGLLGSALFVGDNTDPFVSAVYIGFLVTNGSTTIYGGELFDEPIPIGKEGDWIEVDVVLPLNALVPVQ